MTMLQTPTPSTFDQLVSEWAEREYRLLPVDLYRDIHKGIRAELFAVTQAAGNGDPASDGDRAALAAHVDDVAATLASHAHHEDAAVDAPLQEHLPALADRIERDHVHLESRFDRIVEIAHVMADPGDREARRLLQLLHLDLSAFTSEYLAHLVLEERVVMPALEAAVGPEEVIAIHGAIVGSIPPDEMGRSLSFMLPAMNVEDRVELLGGLRLGAPPEAFDAVSDLARTVLRPDEHVALQRRLGVH
jgi:uncharacterized protein YciW